MSQENMLKSIRLFGLLIILASIYNFGYKNFLVIGDSMNPSKEHLDMVLIDKLYYHFEGPRQGDVIVFYDYESDEFMIKRVIGLPGDVIQIIDGYIYRNHELYIDDFAHVKTGNMTYYPEEVGDGEYWVIGDNRDDSWWGIIYVNEIIGKIKQ